MLWRKPNMAEKYIPFVGVGLRNGRIKSNPRWHGLARTSSFLEDISRPVVDYPLNGGDCRMRLSESITNRNILITIKRLYKFH